MRHGMNKSMVRLLYSAGGLAIASQCFAGGFEFGGSFLRQLDGTVLKSESSIDLTHINAAANHGFGLNSLDGTSDAVRSVLENRGLSPYVRMKRTRQQSSGGLGLDSTTPSVLASDYQFHVGNFAVCGVTLRTVEHPDGSVVVVGNIPLVDQVGTFSENDWPDLNSSARMAIDGVAKNQGLNAADAKVASTQRCLMNEQGSLEPVWDFVVDISGYQFSVWSTPWRVASASPRYFDATATVRAYDPNQTTGKLNDYTITVNGDGTLTNGFFTTSDYTGAERASSTSNSFVYSGTSDSHFAEASTFAYVNQQYDFVSGKGYTWQGAKPITVIIHAKINGTVNNALYTPNDSSTGGPTIKVGDGDGTTLQNLPFDADVVSHEFGHHVIYQSVTQIQGESLVLHEGLADFLAFSRTGDSCLGESICPAGSTLCQVASKCLRSADNTLKYQDATYNSFASRAHLQGQLVSGVLWDLRKNSVIPGDTLTTYLLEAVPYLPSNADIKSLIAAILYVDQKHSATYQAGIISTATARNLSPSTLGINLDDLKSSLASSAATASTDDSSSKKGGFLGCGTVGAGIGPDQSNTAWMVLILFVLPIIVRVLPKRRLVLIPVKSKNR